MGLVKKLGIVKYIVFLLVIAAPISYADADAGMNVGGGFGIHIEVKGNGTNTTDNEDTDAGVYVHSYVESAGAEREDNYAFTGEKINFEIYTKSTEDIDEVIIGIADDEIECGKKHSSLDDGEQLPDEFSGQAAYDEELMSYYECSLVLDESITGEKDIKIKALANDDTIKKEIEEWELNPQMSVEVFTGTEKIHLLNKKSISLGIRQPCEDSIKLLEPEGDMLLRKCGGYITIAAN